MLSDEQLAEQLRAELEALRPPGDLPDRVRQQAATNSQRFGRVRSPNRGPRFRARLAGGLALAASIIAVVAVGGAILQSGPNSATSKKAAANTTPVTTTAKHSKSPAKKAPHVKTAGHKATSHSAPVLPTTSASAIPPTTAAAPPATTPTTATPPTTSATPPATTTTTATPPLTTTTHQKSHGCPPYCGY